VEPLLPYMHSLGFYDIVHFADHLQLVLSYVLYNVHHNYVTVCAPAYSIILINFHLRDTRSCGLSPLPGSAPLIRHRPGPCIRSPALSLQLQLQHIEQHSVAEDLAEFMV
jgi:hypothetical protein